MTVHPRPPAASALAFVFTGGFRPFFFVGSLHAAAMIALWVPWFLGFMHVPTILSPVVWHQHELLFGYVPAVIAGFLLAAVPNWTGRQPLTGLPLVLLFGLWLAGRVVVFCSEQLGYVTTVIIAGAFLPVLGLLVLRELIAARNSRNYKVVAIIAGLFAAQVAFYCEVDRFGYIELAGRFAVALIVLLIAVIAGRIIPAFTGNWLRQNNPGPLPAPFGRFDLTTMVLSFVALLAWIAAARTAVVAPIAGVLSILAGALQFVRQLRWAPHRTLGQPLVTILHVAFLFVPVGFFLTGAALLTDNSGLHSAGTHAWTAGVIGTMTLAVMTRATRGHSGRALHAPASTVLFIYAPIVLATAARIAASILPEHTMTLLPLAGVCWVVAFLGFAGLYGPLLLRRPRAKA